MLQIQVFFTFDKNLYFLVSQKGVRNDCNIFTRPRKYDTKWHIYAAIAKRLSLVLFHQIIDLKRNKIVCERKTIAMAHTHTDILARKSHRVDCIRSCVINNSNTISYIAIISIISHSDIGHFSTSNYASVCVCVCVCSFRVSLCCWWNCIQDLQSHIHISFLLLLLLKNKVIGSRLI